jgi:hypothetical protein
MNAIDRPSANEEQSQLQVAHRRPFVTPELNAHGGLVQATRGEGIPCYNSAGVFQIVFVDDADQQTCSDFGLFDSPPTP